MKFGHKLIIVVSTILVLAAAAASAGSTFFGTTLFDVVGIGTATPAAELGIKNDASNSYVVDIDAADGDNLFRVYENSAYGSQLFMGNTTGHTNVQFSAGGGVSYILGGDFGIGTSSPDYDLSVYDATGSAYIEASNGGLTIQHDAGLVLDGDDDAYIYLRRNGTNQWRIYNNRGEGDWLYFQNRTSGTSMYIKQNGDVWVAGDMSVESLSDRTERSNMTDYELLEKIKAMDFSKDHCNGDGSCEVDKTQYPELWLSEYDYCLEYEQVPIYKNESDTKTLIGYSDGDCIDSEVRYSRDLTRVTSDLLRLQQKQLLMIDYLESELCKKDATYAFCT